MGILGPGSGERRMEAGFERGVGASMDGNRGSGRTDPLTPRGRGRGSSCDMKPPVREGRRRAGEDLDAPEGAPATLGAKARGLGQKIEGGLHCLVGLRLPMGWRVELAKREAAAGQEAGPTGIGQEPVVTDADEAFWEDVEEEAATELAEGK